ncbi:hypothetical protein OG864_45355 [Streptomyces sp. NBC_00124]|uniref:hypothetical protein n=1 Tax=Streptomyces sp. NBC_00124 TaxID=2975662 RepID=UPI00225394C3|nr:hypothetical protein [Streptomyces sp. NBC_00124]MCX5365931.1 hypothetical protein [Streptomyces sp. NBC_00124]
MSDDTTPPITVKRIGVHIPVTAEQLLDAGLPLPPGMEPPPPMPRPSLYRRWRWAYREWVQNTRERVGFWIAGYTPSDSDW